MTVNTITCADAAVFISVAGLYDTPQQVQGFAPDAMFDIPDLTNAELQFGADGVLTAGFIFNLLELEFTLQASSLSCAIFDVWYGTEAQARAKLQATCSIGLPGVNTIFDYSNGYLTMSSPMPSGHRVLQPRKWKISFGQVAVTPSA